jgi:hypothetical protein
VDDDIDLHRDTSLRAAEPGASDRLRLEVDLLTTPEAHPPMAASRGAPGLPTRLVLVAVGEPELTTYVRRCLWEQPGLLSIEPEPGESLLVALRRLRPALLITEPAVIGERSAAPRTPVLLLVQEPGDAAEIGAATSSRLTVLVQPFNARRLLAAVASLLGPGSNVQPP